MADPLDALVDNIRKSAKYRTVSESLIRRIATTEMEKRRKPKEALKATKNKLHQIGAAYLNDSMPYDKWLAILRETSDIDARKEACRTIAANHASTRERLPVVEDFYTQIFAHLPPFHSILDIACGLNPLLVPWMPLEAGTVYHAVDIYSDMIDFVGESLKLMGVENQAVVGDVGGDDPLPETDVALVLKTLPCLEQSDKTAPARLLERITARHLVISYPVKSLGGRDKGMAANYTAHLENLLVGRDWTVTRLDFETELVFVVAR